MYMQYYIYEYTYVNEAKHLKRVQKIELYEMQVTMMLMKITILAKIA